MAFPDSGCGALPGGCAAPGVTQRSDDAYMHASTSLVDKLICLGVSMNPQVVVEGYIETPTNELSLGARSRRRLPRRCELGHSIGDEREERRGVVGGTEGGGREESKRGWVAMGVSQKVWVRVIRSAEEEDRKDKDWVSTIQ